MKDSTLLIKLLNLTMSDTDAEALNAIRKANSLVESCGSSWQDIITPKGNTPIPRPEPAKPKRSTKEYASPPKETVKSKYRSEDIPFMLDTFEEDDAPPFIISLRNWWSEHGFLTEAQYKSLINIYEKYTGV